MAERKYKFNWDVVGADFADARPSLGESTKVAVYRLFQFTMRDVIEQRYGTEATDKIFLEAGVVAGRAFFEKYCSNIASLKDLTRIVQQQFKDLGIGLVRFEVTDTERNTFQLTVDEDLDCSGLPDSEDQICIYDEGFIKGILDAFTGLDFTVREVDCWCSGSRTCRFRANINTDSVTDVIANVAK